MLYADATMYTAFIIVHLLCLIRRLFMFAKDLFIRRSIRMSLHLSTKICSDFTCSDRRNWFDRGRHTHWQQTALV